jgi:glycosyltransferase involved in cell wall biosynthesis
MLNSQAFVSKRFKKLIFLKILKALGFYNDFFFHATNKTEKESIQKILGHDLKIIVASNLARKLEQNLFKKKVKSINKIKFVSIARISKEKGTLTALKALCSIKLDENVIVEYDLFGVIYDFKYWNKCLLIINSLPKNIIVTYKNVVESSKIPKLLLDYHFLLLPSEGENFGHSIFESFSAGLPVIISDNTPWRNLKTKKIGWDISLDNPKEISSSIEYAIKMSQKEYLVWSENAFKFAISFRENDLLLKANQSLFE